MRPRVVLVAALVVTGVAGGVHARESRGLRVVRAPTGETVTGDNWLLLIAIGRYAEWPPLGGPRTDAKALKEVLLSRYAFDAAHVVELYDGRATKAGIIGAFRELGRKAKPEDTLLVYYAGHGHTDRFTKTGYWIPHDAGLDEIAQERWLPNTAVRGALTSIPCAHVLLISDSCFSGDLLSRYRAKPPRIDDEYFRRAWSMRSRQVMTSGASEPVSDAGLGGHSAFAFHLLDTLKRNRDPYVDPLAVFEHVRRGVGGQMPLLGSMPGAGHQEGGSYIFFLREGGASAGARRPQAGSATETEGKIEALRRELEAVKRKMQRTDRDGQRPREAERVPDSGQLDPSQKWHAYRTGLWAYSFVPKPPGPAKTQCFAEFEQACNDLGFDHNLYDGILQDGKKPSPAAIEFVMKGMPRAIEAKLGRVAKSAYTAGGLFSFLVCTFADCEKTRNQARLEAKLDPARKALTQAIILAAAARFPTEVTEELGDISRRLRQAPNRDTATRGRKALQRIILGLHLTDKGIAFRKSAQGEAPAKPARPREGTLTLDLGGGVTMELVPIPAGEFTMGSPNSQKSRSSDEGPQHRVRITRPFYMGKYEVTQAQYERIMGTNPSKFKGSNLPVEMVTWNDATEFCRKLSQRTGRQARLPTEAEWEYACRAGTTTPFHFGSRLSSSQANFNGAYPYGGAAKGVYRKKTTTAGSFPANTWGLHDMHGNVWEWCADWYDKGYYAKSPRDDPSGPANEGYRVLRGGSWSAYGRNCRSANRHRNRRPNRTIPYGFRAVVVSAPGG